MFFIPNTLYIQNLEVIAEAVIVGVIYFYEFEKPIQKRIILLLTVIVTFVSIYSYSSTDVSSVSLSVFRFFLIILSLSYFNNVLSDMRVSKITKHSLFWFSSGLLIYSTGTFFIMLFSEYWYRGVDKVSAEVFDKYWNASQLLFVIFCLFSSVGLWFSKYDKENFI
ncbi:hypothetical protein [Spirosoma radiotolerans]|nr:hypothetical protein [Spirosoma radiotolerans]